MGLVVWVALTAATFAAGMSLALRVGRRFSIGDQLVAASVVAVAIVVSAIQALGYLDILYDWALATLVSVVDGMVLLLSRPGAQDWRTFTQRLTLAARRSLAPASALATVAVMLCLAYLATYVVLLPTWGWDAIWYHNAISAYAYQEHSLRWVDSHIPFINSYPKNVELLSLWNVIFSPDDTLVDAVQLPLALVGVVAIASMCRRTGASAPISWTLGLCWILVPAVVLNIPSSYNDVAAASLRLAAILFLARADATTAHRFFGTLALGVYLGAKVSGLAHAAILGGIVAVVLVREIARSPGRRVKLALQPLAMALTILALGIATYVRDLIRHGNPVWPARVTILGHSLPGTWDWSAFDSPPWGGPGGLVAMWRSFGEPASLPLVDIRAGGFGPLWHYVLMPLVGVALLVALWRIVGGRATPGLLPLAAIVATAVATGAPWWSRHVLALPAGGLLAVAILFAHFRLTSLGSVLVTALTVSSLWQVWPMRGAIWEPELLRKSWTLTPAQRSSLKVAPWTHPGIEHRDEAVKPGDAAIYDDSVAFVFQLWRHDWKNRVLYRPMKGSPQQWLAEIDAERARWAVVTRGGSAEGALKGAGWVSMGNCSAEPAGVWMRPLNK